MQYILCHKDFEYPVKTWLGQDLVAIWQRHSPDQEPPKTNLPIIEYESKYDDRVYGELGAWNWIYRNSPDEHNGLHHYRRLGNYLYNNVSVVRPITFNCSLAQQLEYYHSKKVVDVLTQVLESDILYKTNIFFPYNLFSIPKEILYHWLNFVIPRIEKSVEILGYNNKTYEEIVDMVSKDKSFITGGPDKNVSSTYQARWPACAIERLNSIFWILVSPCQYIPCEITLLEKDQKI